MTPSPLERPKKPSQSSNPAIRRPNPSSRDNHNPSGGGGRSDRNSNRGGGTPDRRGNSDNNNLPPQPSPWLDPKQEPQPDPQASFVEYLRWMREPEHEYKDGTKVQILHMATTQANYRDRLTQLNKRTELIAGKDNTFQVKCSWRIRVGGQKGPENILLPAFDALGMPYIPSSTLRGIARTQAIREIMANRNCDWKIAEQAIANYFGSLEAQDRDRCGKVIFLDAYPLPSKSAGLEMDMANNIWKWEGNKPEYDPNPNPFLSLKEPTFLIGLRLASSCQDKQILEQVKKWLVAGLQSGIGSQVNTGYGELLTAGVNKTKEEFFRVEFAIKGQLIHGYQKFTQWNWKDNKWQMRGQAEAEVRPTAFKSMLRYWFRAFALGVLEPKKVQEWEGKLLGAITPKQQLGWIKVNILSGKVTQKEPRPNFEGKNDPCGEQVGILTISLSSEAPQLQKQKDSIKTLFQNLTWLMFNMGGIGQGARRPCYSRQTRDRAPWYRGSTFYIETDDPFWEVPPTILEFKQQFQQRLKKFYIALGQLTQTQINYNSRREAVRVSPRDWIDAVDRNCEIVICAGENNTNKPHALSILHSQSLKIPDRNGRPDYDGNLCGKVGRQPQPSPIWIADLEDYQIVTVFGANQNPRQTYVNELRRFSRNNYASIFPLP